MRSSRRRETRRGERIVLEEEQLFDGWLVALQAVPTIRHLRARADEIRTEELGGRWVGATSIRSSSSASTRLTRDREQDPARAAVARLRAERDREEGLAVLEAARELFALDDGQRARSDATSPRCRARSAPSDPGKLEDDEPEDGD